MSAVLVEVDRLAEVVCLILDGRTGPSVEEIVEAAKSGGTTDQQAIDALERDFAESARHKQEIEIPCGEMLDEDPAHDTTVHRERAENVLLTVLNDMPARQRQCVELYFFDGLTQEQIAKRLCISQPAVSARIAAARARIVSSKGEGVVKQASRAVHSRESILLLLMHAPDGKQKRHHPPIYPYELWRRFNVAGYWAGNGIYATQYEDKLSQYLEDCFGCPGVAIPRGV